MWRLWLALGLGGVLLTQALWAAPWAPDLAQARLAGGATVRQDADLQSPVLNLDGAKGSYATLPPPGGGTAPRNLRVSVRVRLPQYRAATAPLAWPGAFMFYVSGEGKPWVILFAGKQRRIYAAEDPLSLNQWHTLSFEYRAEDYGLLYVDGRSVLTLNGAGTLDPGGAELWLGRYYWKDPADGQEHEQWMQGEVAQPALEALPDDSRLDLSASGLHNALNVSWGDAIVLGKDWRKLNRPEHTAPFVAECRRLAVDKVFLRVSDQFITTYCEQRMPEDHWYRKALREVQGDMMKAITEACHRAGIKVYAYHTIFDYGSPTSVLYAGQTPFFWEDRFCLQHPEYLVASRDGKQRQYGVLCYAYPEARQHAVGVIKDLMGRWDFDGLYLCTRTHSQPAEFADQFGYNEPIAAEFQRRHGVDIRTQDFSRSQWWDLQGEYLTQLLREVRAAVPGKQVLIAMPRADYLGPPYGNLRLDWRTWVQQRLVDGLVLGVISGGWHYPNSRNRPGYVQSEQDSVGLHDLKYDLGQWFGPACQAARAQLYLARTAAFTDRDRELLKNPGMAGFMLYFQ